MSIFQNWIPASQLSSNRDHIGIQLFFLWPLAFSAGVEYERTHELATDLLIHHLELKKHLYDYFFPCVSYINEEC